MPFALAMRIARTKFCVELATKEVVMAALDFELEFPKGQVRFYRGPVPSKVYGRNEWVYISVPLHGGQSS